MRLNPTIAGHFDAAEFVLLAERDAAAGMIKRTAHPALEPRLHLQAHRERVAASASGEPDSCAKPSPFSWIEALPPGWPRGFPFVIMATP